MSDLKVKFGFWNYDRTRPLVEGTVNVEGVDASFHSTPVVTKIFEGIIKGDLDVAELGLTYYLRVLDLGDPQLTAIPVFPNRQFRHSAIYVNTSSGIKKPEDLAGKTVGEFALYGHDAGVWPKGILSDEFGLRPEQCRWIVGRLDWPLPPITFVPRPVPAHVEVTEALEKDLGALLDAGEIDALISANVPKCFLQGSPKVARLFPDPKAVEQDYFRRTGIFPIMHLVVVRNELLAKHPDLAERIYRAFCEAKDATMNQYKLGQIFNNMATMVPWFAQLLGETRQLMGDDWWPYGVKANRKAVDTFLRYHFEQGLSKRHLTCEEIFAQPLLNT